MSHPRSCDIVIDAERNLARARFWGEFDGPAMESATAKIQSTLPQLRPGFTVFADFSGVTSMNLDCVRPLTALMESLRGARVGMLVRVLPEPNRDIGINLLGLVHYRGQVKVVTVDSPADAERVLG